MKIKNKEKKETTKREDIVLYTIREAAEFLRVHPSTVRNWIKSGKINHQLLDTGTKRKAYRIKIEDLERIIKAG